MLWRHDKLHANDGAAEIYDQVAQRRVLAEAPHRFTRRTKSQNSCCFHKPPILIAGCVTLRSPDPAENDPAPPRAKSTCDVGSVGLRIPVIVVHPPERREVPAEVQFSARARN